MKNKFILSVLFGFSLMFSAAGTSSQPVAVASVRNPLEFSQKLSFFLADADPQAGSRAAVLLSAWMLSPQLSAMNLQKPVTGYMYFSETSIQPVLFGTLRQGINPINIPFLPGQILVPETLPGNKIKYVDPRFKKHVLNLKENSIFLPKADLAGYYYFREDYIPGKKSGSHEIAFLMSTELSKISYTVTFPEKNLLNIMLEMEAVKGGRLAAFSNKSFPRLRDRVRILPKADDYFYAVIPADQTFAEGLSMFYAWVVPDFSDHEHIYGKFLNCVISGDHNTALALSKNRDYFLFSGLLPSEEARKEFEKYLQSHGDSYGNQTYIFHNDNGTNVYVRVIGNTANLLIRKNDGEPRQIGKVFMDLTHPRAVMRDREFLSGFFRKADGSYEKMVTGSMLNGKFRLNMKLRPQAVLNTFPVLLTGEDLQIE